LKVQSAIEAWPTGISASFVRIAEQIVASGPNLGLPYTRPFGDGLFEIRAKWFEQYPFMTKTDLAKRMHTSRAALNRLLD
jgi:hypothetical protein